MELIMQINITCGVGSTGKLALSLYNQTLTQGYKADFCYSVYPAVGNDQAFPIESKIQHYLRRGLNKYFGKKIWHSTLGTKRLIRRIKKKKPDLIHLHNIQQNSINYKLLLSYLKKAKIPVVYTLHDCWSFTGGCYHFTERECDGYQNGCHNCLINRKMDDITEDAWKIYKHKEQLIGQNENIQIVCVSNWLKSVADLSYMHRMNKPIRTIYNGIDNSVFYPRDRKKIREEYRIPEHEFVILGVASYWTKEKGLGYYIDIDRILSFPLQIILVGDCTDPEIAGNKNFTIINKTRDMSRLAEIYSTADVFVNASIEETFGMTTAEALACGTPAIVFNSTACPEVVDEKTGIVVEPSIEELERAIITIRDLGKDHYSKKCVDRVANCFTESNMISDYMKLYRSMLHGKNAE